MTTLNLKCSDLIASNCTYMIYLFPLCLWWQPLSLLIHSQWCIFFILQKKWVIGHGWGKKYDDLLWKNANKGVRGGKKWEKRKFSLYLRDKISFWGDKNINYLDNIHPCSFYVVDPLWIKKFGTRLHGVQPGKEALMFMWAHCIFLFSRR